MKKSDEKKMKEILMKNQVPKIQSVQVHEVKRQVCSQAGRGIWESLPKVSFPDRLLRQIPYIAVWVWGVQLAVVFLFAGAVRLVPDAFKLAALLFFTGPVLALLPVVGLVKSYGCNMWEMEAACRYDLRQVTAMRMCIVGTADAAVLAAGGVFYGMERGSIWEFGLLVLVPFLASSSVYLWELEHFSRRCSGYMLAVTGIVLNAVLGPGLVRLYAELCENTPAWAPTLTVVLAVFFSGAMLCSGVRMYRGLGDRKGEYEKWNLE